MKYFSYLMILIFSFLFVIIMTGILAYVLPTVEEIKPLAEIIIGGMR